MKKKSKKKNAYGSEGSRPDVENVAPLVSAKPFKQEVNDDNRAFVLRKYKISLPMYYTGIWQVGKPQEKLISYEDWLDNLSNEELTRVIKSIDLMKDREGLYEWVESLPDEGYNDLMDRMHKIKNMPIKRKHVENPLRA